MKFAYVTLIVGELESPAAFLKEILGFEQTRRLELPDGGEIVFLDKAGATGVELISRGGQVGSLEPVILTFDVEDMDEAMALFAAKGHEPKMGPVPIGGGGLLTQYTGPEGLQVGLVFQPE